MSQGKGKPEETIVKPGWGAGAKGARPPQMGMAKADPAQAKN